MALLLEVWAFAQKSFYETLQALHFQHFLVYFIYESIDL